MWRDGKTRVINGERNEGGGFCRTTVIGGMGGWKRFFVLSGARFAGRYEAISTLSRAENGVESGPRPVLWMARRKNGKEKKPQPHSIAREGREKHTHSRNVPQHRISVQPPDFRLVLQNRTSRLAARALSNKRMKRRCLWRYQRSGRIFPKFLPRDGDYSNVEPLSRVLIRSRSRRSDNTRSGVSFSAIVVARTRRTRLTRRYRAIVRLLFTSSLVLKIIFNIRFHTRARQQWNISVLCVAPKNPTAFKYYARYDNRDSQNMLGKFSPSFFSRLILYITYISTGYNVNNLTIYVYLCSFFYFIFLLIFIFDFLRVCNPVLSRAYITFNDVCRVRTQWFFFFFRRFSSYLNFRL